MILHLLKNSLFSIVVLIILMFLDTQCETRPKVDNEVSRRLDRKPAHNSRKSTVRTSTGFSPSERRNETVALTASRDRIKNFYGYDFPDGFHHSSSLSHNDDSAAKRRHQVDHSATQKAVTILLRKGGRNVSSDRRVYRRMRLHQTINSQNRNQAPLRRGANPNLVKSWKMTHDTPASTFLSRRFYQDRSQAWSGHSDQAGVPLMQSIFQQPVAFYQPPVTFNHSPQLYLPHDPFRIFQGLNIFFPSNAERSVAPLTNHFRNVQQPLFSESRKFPENLAPNKPSRFFPPPPLPPPQIAPPRNTISDSHTRIPQLFHPLQSNFQEGRHTDESAGTPIPKKPALTPSQKLGLCCRKKNLSSSCQTLCNYDTFTDRSLVTAVLTNQCPGTQLAHAFNCATSMADHSKCCIREGINAFNGGQCMAFCTTHRGNPNNAFQYIACLQVFDRIKQCYHDYHVTHPNIFGDF